MLKSELNEFSKYQSQSTYKPKTQDRLIEIRNPLEYYQQNNIQTQNWDESLLQTRQPIKKELDRINNLVETLFVGRDFIKKDQQQVMELNQSKIVDVKEKFKEEDQEILNQKQNQKIQDLANIKNELLNIQCEYMNRSQLRTEINEFNYQNQKKYINEDEILKALKILQN